MAAAEAVAGVTSLRDRMVLEGASPLLVEFLIEGAEVDLFQALTVCCLVASHSYCPRTVLEQILGSTSGQLNIEIQVSRSS